MYSKPRHRRKSFMLVWRVVAIVIPVIFAADLALAAKPIPKPSPAWAGVTRLAGGATVYAYGKGAFTHAMPELDLPLRAQFSKGAEEFNAIWRSHADSTAASANHIGLGPLYNAAACGQCHFGDGRSITFAGDYPISPMVLLRTLPNGGIMPEQTQSIAKQEIAANDILGWRSSNHSLPDGTQYPLRQPSLIAHKVARAAPAVIGLGLLEAVPDGYLLQRARQQPYARFGIFGKVRMVTGPATPSARPGRFGWKNDHASLPDQVAQALVAEMGITNPLLSSANAVNDTASPIEISSDAFEQLVAYMRLIGVPARQLPLTPTAMEGARLFEQARCVMCHAPSLPTGQEAALANVRDQTIYPFTDLLLHDMGERLADGEGEWRRYWRTAPLWAIGVQKQVAANAGFLHDGRARTLLEAILWHDGEAFASRQLFERMRMKERTALLQFLESL